MARRAHPGSASTGAAGVSAVPDNTNSERTAPVILPGALLGFLGGGQLGRMTAMAARTMGYRVRVMDPEAACPASFVADETIVGRWDDVDAARRLATGVDAVTLEIEQIGVDALSAVAQVAPLRPGVEPIRIIQDKTLQKTWLAENGFPCRPVSRGAQRGRPPRGSACARRQCISQDWPRRIRRPRPGADRLRSAAGLRKNLARARARPLRLPSRRSILNARSA